MRYVIQEHPSMRTIMLNLSFSAHDGLNRPLSFSFSVSIDMSPLLDTMSLSDTYTQLLTQIHKFCNVTILHSVASSIVTILVVCGTERCRILPPLGMLEQQHHAPHRGTPASRSTATYLSMCYEPPTMNTRTRWSSPQEANLQRDAPAVLLPNGRLFSGTADQHKRRIAAQCRICDGAVHRCASPEVVMGLILENVSAATRDHLRQALSYESIGFAQAKKGPERFSSSFCMLAEAVSPGICY
jgi:hypothetical protein